MRYWEGKTTIKQSKPNKSKQPKIIGLNFIPIEIRLQGTRKMISYLLDLFKSPKGNPLYRTKLMVVGNHHFLSFFFSKNDTQK